jgi:hypothetical protein
VIFAAIFFFIAYEGFYLFPEYIRIPAKGIFRMRDVIIIIAPLILLFSITSVTKIIKNNYQASLLVAFPLFWYLLNPLLAQLFFDQPYLSGLIGYRHNLSSYLLYFVFSVLIVTEHDIKTLCKIMVIFVAGYFLILIAYRSDPSLRLIYYDHEWYEKASMVRYGGRRMFMPYGLVYFFFFFIVLAELLYGNYIKSKMHLLIDILFLGLILRGVLLGGSRQFIFAIPLVCIFALWKSSRKYYVIALLVVFMFFKQSVSMLNTSDGGGWLGKSRIGMLFTDSPSIKNETGRQFQNSVCIDNFMRSPLVGVGSLIDSKRPMEEYQKYGFFNCPDIGITKMAAENGIVGLIWVICFYLYVFRKTGEIIRSQSDNMPTTFSVIVARGIRYFYILLGLTSLTLPHFIAIEAIPVISLSLVLLNVAGNSSQQKFAASQQGANT